jgi:hypothetical protein
MKKFAKSISLLCGLILSLAASSAFGQKGSGEFEINRKPLKDFAASVKTKSIDWTKPFLVEAETALNRDGRFEQTKFTKTEGDTGIVAVVKQAFEAAGESGWFGYLSQQGMKEIKISAVQNAENFAVSIVSEQPTPERANTLSSGMNALVNFVLMADKNGLKKLGDDEKKLLNGAKVTAREKTVNINLSLAAGDFQEMIRRHLSEGKDG